MRKIRFIGLFVILIVTYTLFALGEEDYSSLKSIEAQKNWLDNKFGIQITGGNFEFQQLSNTLTISSGSSAKIPESFDGGLKINGGTIKLEGNAEFSGKGYYSNYQGFQIEDGFLNKLHIISGNEVYYNGNQIYGVAGKNCMISDQPAEENSVFFYNEGDNKIKFIGDQTKTTLPNANIALDGSVYKYGNMEIDVLNSKLYLGQRGKITFDGIELTAQNRPVRIFFEEDEGGYTLKPFKGFVVSNNDISVSDVFNEAGYQGSENFNKRRETYESKYRDEKYTGAGAQNIKFLDALKSGDAVLFYNDQASNTKTSNVRIIFRLTDSTPISTPNGPTAKEIFQKANSPDYAVPQSVARYAGQPDIKAVLGSINDDMLRHIIEHSNKNNLPPIIPIIIGSVESRFNDGVGCKGVGEQSCGIMQIKPSTAVSLGFNAQDPLDPHKSIEIATKYLGQFNQRYIEIPMPERSLHIMAAYKQGAYGYETKGISQSTKDYLLKGDQFQKGLEPQINSRISKLK